VQKRLSISEHGFLSRRQILAPRQQENLGNPRTLNTESTHPRLLRSAAVLAGQFTECHRPGALAFATEEDVGDARDIFIVADGIRKSSGI